MALKIEKKKFVEFLKKVKVDAKSSINDFRLEFKDEGLVMNGISSTNNVLINGLLKKEAFIEYKTYSTVAITDIQEIIKVIDRFDKELVIDFGTNVMKITSNTKEVLLDLTDLSVIPDVTEQTMRTINRLKSEFTTSFDMGIDLLDSVISDAMVSKDAELIITTFNGKVTFSNTGKFKFTNTYMIDEVKEGVKVKFGQPIVDALANIKSDVRLSIKSDYPMMIVEETPDSFVRIVVTPLVERD